MRQSWPVRALFPCSSCADSLGITLAELHLEGAIPLLLQLLRHPVKRGRAAAMEALRAFPQAAGASSSVLNGLLSEKQDEVRFCLNCAIVN